MESKVPQSIGSSTLSGFLRTGQPVHVIGKDEVSSSSLLRSSKPLICLGFRQVKGFALLAAVLNCYSPFSFFFRLLLFQKSGPGISILTELVLKRIPYRVIIKKLGIPEFHNIDLAFRYKKSSSFAVERFIEYQDFRESEN